MMFLTHLKNQSYLYSTPIYFTLQMLEFAACFCVVSTTFFIFLQLADGFLAARTWFPGLWLSWDVHTEAVQTIFSLEVVAHWWYFTEDLQYAA